MAPPPPPHAAYADAAQAQAQPIAHTPPTVVKNDSIIAFHVPMKDAAPVKPAPTMIDASSLTNEGLEILKKQDPFLYYSIPGVRTAAVRNKSESVEMSSLISSNSSHSSISVERRSCVSVECDFSSLGLGGSNDDAPVQKRRRRWSYSYNAGSKFQKAI
jgi:hypothetical protein